MIETFATLHPKVGIFYGYYFQWMSGITAKDLPKVLEEMLEKLIVERKFATLTEGACIFDKNGFFQRREPPEIEYEDIPQSVRHFVIATAKGHSYNETDKALAANKAVQKIMKKHGFKKTAIDGVPNPNHSCISRITLWSYTYPEVK